MKTKNIRTHLSIDLDFWAGTYPPYATPLKFMRKVFSLGIPIKVYMTHEQVTPQVCNSKCNRLVNVDYHSDLVRGYDPRTTLPAEGDWVDHVSWQNNGEFIWCPPNTTACVGKGEGRCDGGSGLNWAKSMKCDRSEARGKAWRDIILGKATDKFIKWDTVTSISVCVSPDYIRVYPLHRAKVFLLLGVWFLMKENIKTYQGNNQDYTFTIDRRTIKDPKKRFEDILGEKI